MIPGDNATIISVYPFPLIEFKPGLIPNEFKVPASENGIPAVFDVPDAKFWVRSFTGGFWITVRPLVLAQSIVEDRLKAMIDVNFFEDPKAYPGIGFLPGKITPAAALKEHKDFLEDLKDVQNRYFVKLIAKADDDWAKFKRHELITDTQRYAARSLNIEREWSLDIKPGRMMPCPVCTTVISAQAIKCPHCGAILDEEKAKKFKFGMG